MPDSSAPTAPRVVVAGGGVAAVETLLALRAASGAQRIETIVLAPNAELPYRPLSVAEPFGRAAIRHYPLADVCADVGAALVPATLASVDAAAHVVTTGAGERHGYDALVVATGGTVRPALPHAYTFLADDPDDFQWVVRELEDGAVRSVAFVVPPGNGWALPLYELALMTARRAWEAGVEDLALTLVTPEDVPLAAFRGAGSDAAARLLGRADIELVTSAYAHDYDGRALLVTPGGRRIVADRVVALPRLAGPAITGLPSDADGFVRVDEHGRVPRLDGVYAVGDATTFPIKQGGIASQQADHVAALVAAAASGSGRVPPAPRPSLRAVLLTGSSPLYLTATITGGESVASSASESCPWWPPHKVAARHLAPYLADLEQRVPAPQPAGEAERW